MHSSLLIVGILTIGFTLASFFAYIMQRLRLSAILGYLLAGYIIGPYSPGFVADSGIAEQLAEIGVILMLFGVGLHFKIEDLLRVKNIAIPGAVGQTFVATIVTTFIVHSMGWSIESGLIIGLSIGVASTVVLVRILTDNHVLDTSKGHIAVGWLVVEDIFTVIVLILLPTIAAFSGDLSFSFITIGETLFLIIAKLCILAFFMFTWGHKIVDYILTNVVRLRSQELFTLTIIAFIFLIATGSALIFGTSIALGAFIAGMVIGKTNVKHQAAASSLSIKDIFSVIFFLSVGMLFNPIAIISHFSLFAGILFVILLIKPLVAYLLILSLGYSLNIALTVAISLAQIGEFSFILAEEAMNLHLIAEEGFDVLVACALVSIAVNPLLFQMIGRFESVIQKLPFLNRKNKAIKIIKEEQKPSSKVLIIGFGPIGRETAKIVYGFGFAPIIIEQNIDTVLNEENYTTLFGDATDPIILKDAGIEESSHLLITIPDTAKMTEIIHVARDVNPAIQIIARTQYVEDKPLLEKLHVHYICTESEALKAFTSLTRQLFTSWKEEKL